MPTKKTGTQHNFPPGLARPALRALDNAGYTKLSQLTRVTREELMQLHGMGPKALRLIETALNAEEKSLYKK